MKKIELEMCMAFENGRAWRSANTAVEKDSGAVIARLHGSAIFKCEDGRYSFTLAGWNTVTTRSRINALLDAVVSGNHRVHTYKFRPMFDGKPIASDEWVAI